MILVSHAPRGHPPTELDRLSHWASVDLGFSPGFPLPAEKAVAPHSSTLGWKLPWMEEPGGLQSVGS